MEIIRKETDYAIRALLHLARAEGRQTRCAEVAQSCDIPKSFAYKILGRLAGAGLVVGRAGRAGGFRLNRSPKRITLRHVVDAVQGPLAVSPCLVDPAACSRRKGCPVAAKWVTLQRSIVNFLGHTTLDDLAGARA